MSRGSVSLDFKLNDSFTLPFLNLGDGDQSIALAVATPKIDADTLNISCNINVLITFAKGQTLSASVNLVFDPRRMAFLIDRSQGLWFTMASPVTLHVLDLDWTFSPSTGTQIIPGSITRENPNGTPVASAAFVLTVQNGNYGLRLAPGATIEIDYTRATSADQPIKFLVSEFALTPKGIDLVAEVTDTPAKFNGLETQFQFKSGSLQIHEGKVAGFTIAGSGPVPRSSATCATADIALQFAQVSSDVSNSKPGGVRRVRGSAKLSGSNLLRCTRSRFDFSVDGIGLEFVEDGGADHLYFTLSGRARYSPKPGDDKSGPLSWLPKVEIQLVDCPLTGNMSVIAKHVKFMVELPRPVKFDLMGCFGMEIRGIGFVPQFDKLPPENGKPPGAMQLAGQIFFAEGGGDAIETKVDFHNLYVVLPKPGSDLPRSSAKAWGSPSSKARTLSFPARSISSTRSPSSPARTRMTPARAPSWAMDSPAAARSRFKACPSSLPRSRSCASAPMVSQPGNAPGSFIWKPRR